MADDCPNCGQKDSEGAWEGARSGSSEWGHPFMCCSNACGIRLGKRIENGMINIHNINQSLYGFDRYYKPIDKRKIALRIRIKQLEHKIKSSKNGCNHYKVTYFENWPDGGMIEICK